MTAAEIYLKEPIVIKGITIKHTRAGLEWLVKHYKAMMLVNTENKLTGIARKPMDEQYMAKLIEQWEQHIELYDNL